MIGVGLDMKKYNLLFFIVVICALFISPKVVKAADYLEDDCVTNKTCMVVCSYFTDYQNNVNADDNNRLTTIYYNFNEGTWKVSWKTYGEGNPNPVFSKGFDPLGYVFSDEGDYTIYIPKKHTAEEFVCPANAYIDFSVLNPYNELCFDNNGTWCEEDKSNIGTNFSQPSEKLYDFSDEIETYFDLWYNSEVSSSLTCDSIYNETTTDNIYDTLMTQFTNDMSNMFVFNGASGTKIPNFITNSPGWQNVSSTLENYVYDVTNSCREETESAYENGDITEEERDRRLGLLDDYEDATEEAVGRHTDPRENNATTNNWNKEIQCEDIFDFDKVGSVGWMLNTIFNYIKVIGPILVVLLSSLDFIKAVLGTDEKAMKEAQNKLIIRLVAAVALFLIPTLVQLLLQLINVSLNPECFLK